MPEMQKILLKAWMESKLSFPPMVLKLVKKKLDKDFIIIVLKQK